VRKIDYLAAATAAARQSLDFRAIGMLPSARRLVFILLLVACVVHWAAAECQYDVPSRSLKCARVDELLAVDNRTADAVEFVNIVGDQVTAVLLQEHVWRLSVLRSLTVTHGALTAVEWFAFQYNDYLMSVDLSRNRITEAPWQSFSHVKQSFKLDLAGNVLESTCVNYWLVVQAELNAMRTFRARDGSDYQQSATHMFHLPATVKHSLPQLANYNWTELDCASTSIRVSSLRSLLLTRGREFRLSCRLNASPALPTTANRFPPFEWIKTELSERQPPVRINVSGADFLLTAVADERHLGWVACKSWSTLFPVYDLFDVAIESGILTHVRSVPFTGRSRRADITVIGYPLTELNMTVTRLIDMRVEHFDYNNTLFYGRQSAGSAMVVLKLSGNGQFFKQVYRVFPLSCGMMQCPDVMFGNYSLVVCNRISCNANHFSLLPPVHTDATVVPLTSSPLTESPHPPTWLVLVVIAAVLAAFFVGVVYLKRTGPKKRHGWELSRATEETGIPLQMRNSNYTLREVPYLPRQSLKIMEEIGQGAFGEVFVADWDCSADRVAIKVLKQFHAHMQEEFEREAALMAKLLHPHIVRFFGVSRDGDQNLLLIFEYMNLGDLKTYLRKRGIDALLQIVSNNII
jgi:hypothetical protein